MRERNVGAMARQRHMWNASIALVLYMLVVQGVLLLVTRTYASAEEECAAPMCAILCDEGFESTMRDELKEMCACDMLEDVLTPAPDADADARVELLFVQRAASATLSNATLTLFDVGDVIWFTDRPDRAAGVWQDNEYLHLFAPSSETSDDDANSFSSDPPNAVLACTLESSGDELNVVMEVTDPVVSSSDESVSYSVVILEDVTGLFSSDTPAGTSSVRCMDAHLFVDPETGDLSTTT